MQTPCSGKSQLPGIHDILACEASSLTPPRAAQVAARHVEDPAARSALTREAGQRLAQRIAGDAIALARISGHEEGISDSTKAAVTSALQVVQ